MSFLSKALDFASSDAGGKIIGSTIGAVGSLIGGGINAANASSQMAMQREFAQNGIRWKVADAKAAGIHPLAALGAQTFSYNPVMTGDSGVSDALAQMGQGVQRAAEAKALAEERELNKELVNAQIRRTNAETDAIMQQAEASKNAVAKTAAPPPMPKVNAKTGLISPKESAYHVWDMGNGDFDILLNPEYQQTIGDEFGQVVTALKAITRAGHGVWINPEDGVAYVYNGDSGYWRRLRSMSPEEARGMLGNVSPSHSGVGSSSHFERNRYRYRY